MRYAILLVAMLLAGCEGSVHVDSTPTPTPVPKPITIGPLKIVEAHFDFHQMMESPDGTRFEFNHCSWVSSLAREGRFVEITYTGDYRELLESRNCAKVLSVKVLPRKGHWIGKHAPMKYVIDGEDRVCGNVDQLYSDTSYRADADGGLYEHYLNLESAIKAVEDACK